MIIISVLFCRNSSETIKLQLEVLRCQLCLFSQKSNMTPDKLWTLTFTKVDSTVMQFDLNQTRHEECLLMLEKISFEPRSLHNKIEKIFHTILYILHFKMAKINLAL